jgi:chromosome segregation protein
MHVTRLRLSGFKSFVEPTDFPIAPGLTGIIGPNGCGKSNLLEALRWVMGAASAKAMRGEGMDDVIFAGAAGRAPRGHAEVTMTLDASDGSGPAAYAGAPVLEVTRRIDRGQGSSYRINGAEARARDVQLLFADASTGANSPALVRQGQISELIAARPQNRRRILEEAAGVAGLHGRRHEALLRLKAAEANLERLADLAREVEASQSRLKREARTAARYRTLAAEVRKVEGALALARWTEARTAEDKARLAADSAAARALETARAAAAASAARLKADEPLVALREEAVAAAAVRAHLAIEMDRAERDLNAARTEAGRLEGEVTRILGDLEREGRIGADADAALERLASDALRLEREIAAEPERTPILRTAAEAAEAQRGAAEAAVESLAARLAAAEAERRAAEARARSVRERLARAEQALAAARAERATLGEPDDAPLARSRAAADAAARAEAQARQALEEAETLRADAARDEAAARLAMRAAGDELASVEAAVRGLNEITRAPAGEAFPPVMDQVEVDAGFEAALAAALGDDLAAALDSKAPIHWESDGATASPKRPPSWPDGVLPLSDRVKAPAALAARLAFIGLVDPRDGDHLRQTLPPGTRLVSRQGDLWRWDGLIASADAPRPAQVRLEQKTRLAALESRIVDLRAQAALTRETHDLAAARLAQTEAMVRSARAAPAAAASTAAQARETLMAQERAAALSAARIAALDQTLERLEAERAAALAPLADADAALADVPADTALQASLAEARTRAAAAREASFAARAGLEREEAARAARARRMEGLRREIAEWRERAGGVQARQTRLAKALEDTRTALDGARAAPAKLDKRHEDLADQSDLAAAREAGAARALAAAETERAERERAARSADAAAADAREVRAGADAHLDSARARVTEMAAAISEATGLTPEDLAVRISADAVAVPPEAGGVEAHLAALKSDLASLGQVNLRAEEDLADLTARLTAMAGEREDLAGALARLRRAIDALESEGRDRLMAAFHVIDGHFRDLFTTLFQGGAAELRLVESADPLESGLEIFACPPGKRLAVMSLMSGGEQALTAVALIFAVFLSNPAPICVLDEVDAPLDDANVERFCNLLDAMRHRAPTRFLTITHNPLTMSRMDRLFGVTMREKGVSQLVSVDLGQARRLAAS